MEIVEHGKFILVRGFSSENDNDLNKLSAKLECSLSMKEEIAFSFPVCFRRVETPAGPIERADFILIVKKVNDRKDYY